MQVHLTETAIAKATRDAWKAAARADLSDAVCPGLRLRLTPPSRKSHEGSRSWVLCCRDRQGRMRRFPLGSYPEMTVSKAREAAKALRVGVRGGADPVAERKRDLAMGEAAKAGVGTLAALIATYTAKRGKSLKSWADGRKRVELVFKPLLPRAVATLAAADLQIVADSYRSPQSAAFAVRTLRPVIHWGAQRGYIADALGKLHSPAIVVRRKRVLSRDELARLLPTLAASDRPYAACMSLILLTLARREEAACARWRDIDLAVGNWTMPETKNGEPHIVPLSRQAAALLRARLPRDASGNVVPPLPTAPVFATASGGKLLNWDRETKVIMAASETAGWTRHDLRRTGATLLGEMGETPDIIEAALNHTSIRSALAAIYNRSRYRPQVAAALQRLADALDGMAAGAAAAVPLRGLGSADS